MFNSSFKSLYSIYLWFLTKKKLTGMFCNNPTQTTCIHEFGISYHMFASCKILYLICVLRELLLYKTAVKIYGIIHVQA